MGLLAPLGVLLACTGAGPHHPAPAPSVPVVALTLEIHYLLDDKQPVAPPEPAALAAWQQGVVDHRLADPAAPPLVRDLLSHQGGGPGGGEWNGQGDLLLVLSGPQAAAAALQIRLDGAPVASASALTCAGARCLTTVIIPVAAWDAHLRAVQDADRGLLGEAATSVPAADLGQILAVEVAGTWGDATVPPLVKAFSVAYGE